MVRFYFTNWKVYNKANLIGKKDMMKQGEETTEFIKESDDATQKYILQENRKTKIATYMITAVLLIIIIALILSAADLR